MNLEKLLDATVNVVDPINFGADADRHLLTALQNTYVGRCYMGAYVVGVLQIVLRSSCHLVTSNGTGEGYVNVRFLARVVVFSGWDILVGVRVVGQQPMVVGLYEPPGRPERAVVTIMPARPAEASIAPARHSAPSDGSTGGTGQGAMPALAKAVEALAVGQLVPVRVVRADHPPLQEMAAVVGVLLTCDLQAPVYRLRGQLDATAAVELGPLLAAVDAELAARAELVARRRADLWFFEQLLHSYGTSAARADGPGAPPPDLAVPTGAQGLAAATWEGPGSPQHSAPAEGAEAANVLEIVRRAVAGEAVPVAGHWSRPLSLHRSSPLAARADAPPAGWAEAVDGAPRAVFALFLKNILDFLAATRGLAECYDTPELIHQYRPLWAVMRQAQYPQHAQHAQRTP